MGSVESPFEVGEDGAIVTLLCSILWLSPAVFGSWKAGTEEADN